MIKNISKLVLFTIFSFAAAELPPVATEVGPKNTEFGRPGRHEFVKYIEYLDLENTYVVDSRKNAKMTLVLELTEKYKDLLESQLSDKALLAINKLSLLQFELVIKLCQLKKENVTQHACLDCLWTQIYSSLPSKILKCFKTLKLDLVSIEYPPYAPGVPDFTPSEEEQKDLLFEQYKYYLESEIPNGTALNIKDLSLNQLELIIKLCAFTDFIKVALFASDSGPIKVDLGPGWTYVYRSLPKDLQDLFDNIVVLHHWPYCRQLLPN